jgi:hypothetical protein
LDLGAPGCGSVGPCIDQTVFGPMFFSSDYWSADTVSGNPVNAWDVYFRTGLAHTGNKGYPNYVRGVRSGL